MEDYSKMHFGMFAGSKKNVTLRCKKALAGVMFDRFGTEITVMKDEDPLFIKVRVEVEISPIFYGWITGVGAVIASPKQEADAYRQYLLSQIDIM